MNGLRHCRWTIVAAFAVASAAPTLAQAPLALTVFSAGSAKGVLTALFARYRRETGVSVTEVAGPAGAMLDRVEAGEAADLFISANMGYPRRLAGEGKGSPAIVFARNRLCVIALPTVGLAGHLLDRLLDPHVRIGSGNPANDPSGQYAFAMFEKAEAVHPGAAAILKAKDRIAGGAPAPAATVKRNAAEMPAGRGIDAAIGFCSTSDTTPDTSVVKVELPPSLGVPVVYGMTVVAKPNEPARREAAWRLAAWLMSPEAQAVLPSYGFQPVGWLADGQL